MKLLCVSVAVVLTSLCVLTENASASHPNSVYNPGGYRTFVGEYSSFQDRLRTFYERMKGAIRELLSDINLSNFADKLRRFSDQSREAWRDLFFS